MSALANTSLAVIVGGAGLALWSRPSPRSPRDDAMTARETYARGLGHYRGQ